MADTMKRNGIYDGTDLKFALTIGAPGFSMDDDDFEVTIFGRSKKKDIKKEAMIRTDNGKWLVTYNTSEIGVGEHWMKITAFVPDTDFDDGIRTEVIKRKICDVHP